MTLDQTFYQIIARSRKDGDLFIPELGMGQQNEEGILSYIMELDDHFDIVSVHSYNPKEGWSRDVSEDFAAAWYQKLDDVTIENLPQFIQDHISVYDLMAWEEDEREERAADRAMERELASPEATGRV